jgi:lysophospholipid acyltransferase (LPLAT)-like uncharacterized protein
VKTTLQRLEGRGLALYAELLKRTARVEVKGWDQVVGALANGRPTIFVAWHGQTHLVYPLIKSRVNLTRMVMVVVADHRRHVLETFTRAVGAEPFPVSMADQTLAGARSVMGLIQALRAGKISYVTPDGPDGPPRVAKPGVAFIASRAEAQLIPMGAHSEVCYRLRRWDRYALPLPFSRIAVVVRAPIPVSRGTDRSGLLRRLSAELDTAVKDAQRSVVV